MHWKKMQSKVEEEVLNSYEMMYRIAFSYVHNLDDAMDIVQESAYKAIYNAGQVKNEKYIKTWICKIVIHASVDFMKKNQKEIPVEQLYEMDEPSVQDTYQDFDTMQALDSLEEREKAVVILRYFEDRKLEDIAIILDENINTIKSILYRSLKKLKIEIQKGEPNYEG